MLSLDMSSEIIATRPKLRWRTGSSRRTHSAYKAVCRADTRCFAVYCLPMALEIVMGSKAIYPATSCLQTYMRALMLGFVLTADCQCLPDVIVTELIVSLCIRFVL